jgi:hypothetical protein
LKTGRDGALNDIAGWVAPIATMIAAMMTAANLGARLTGWGFVVFTIGSVCWVAIGLSSGQANLLASNAFLTVVNLVGIWRWLGRQVTYEDGADTAKAKSRGASVPSLFTATGIAGMAVVDAEGTPLGKAVEALIECRSGTVSYVVVATGGVAGIRETLRAVPGEAVEFGCDRLTLRLSPTAFEALPALDGGDWPAAAAPHTVTA